MGSSIISRTLALLLLALLPLFGGGEALAGSPHAQEGTARECLRVLAAQAQLTPAVPVPLAAGAGEHDAPNESGKGSHCHCHCGCHAGGVGLLPSHEPGEIQSDLQESVSSTVLGETPLRPALLPHLLPYAQAPPVAC